MIIKRITHNNGKNEGYFLETRRGYIEIKIKEGEYLELKDITEKEEVRFNEINLKMEKVEKDGKLPF